MRRHADRWRSATGAHRHCRTRRGRLLLPLLAAIGAVAVSALLVSMSRRLDTVGERMRRTRQLLVMTSPGDWLFVDSIPAVAGGPSLPLRDRALAPSAALASNAPRGPLTLYVAFSPSCPHCNAIAPTWARLATARREQPALRMLGIAVLTDSSPAGRDSARAFAARHGLDGVALGMAWEPRTLRALTLRAVPQTFLADATGQVWWAAVDSVAVRWLSDSLPTLLERLEARRRPGDVDTAVVARYAPVPSRPATRITHGSGLDGTRR